MKTCSKCKHVKEFTEFYKNKRNKDGYLGSCKVCKNEYARKYHKKNPNKFEVSRKQYYENNKERLLAIIKKDRLANPEKYREKNRKYYYKNKDTSILRSAKRRANKLSLTPSLTDTEQEKIELIYSTCQALNEYGAGLHAWNVDHINPLSNGGLHHPDNLQILTAYENLSKGPKIDWVFNV